MINLDELDELYIKEQYDEYLEAHINNVQKGYSWIKENLRDILPEDTTEIEKLIYNHDVSKYSKDEYMPYAMYFYGKKFLTSTTKDKIEKIDSDFNYAWLHHIHNNPHHWQYWMLQHDDEGLELLNMPYKYIIEMICDWWAFSWKSGNLKEIFNWYNSHKKGILLSENSKKILENNLKKIEEKLNVER